MKLGTLNCVVFLGVQIIFIERSLGAAVHQTKNKCTNEVGDILDPLRALMKDQTILEGTTSTNNAIQAYIVLMNDAHQSEYIADHDKRLQYITKFSGSAGEAVVTATEAVLWTDSRYHLQAEQQLNPNCWTLMKTGQNNVPNMTEWMLNNLPSNSTVGVDPFLMKASAFRQIANELNAKGHELISIARNLIDEIWLSRPPPSRNNVIPLDIEFTGKAAGLKVSEMMDQIKKEDNAESIVVTTLDDIAWLLNLRGSDIKFNPVFFSYLILSPKSYVLFIEKDKLSNETVKQLIKEDLNITVKDYGRIIDGVTELVNTTSGKIIVPTSISQAINELIPENRTISKNVIAETKSVKNPIEAANMEKAHIRDGLALIQYLHWLNMTIDIENVTELSGAKKLEQFREQQEHFRGLSFETISAVGEHAAMAHYSPSVETDKQITRNEIYLVDSGGQYWDGTTDVTRTVHFGVPKDEEKISYTRVLKGFIALATSVFPQSTPLSYLDHVARRPLWQAGLDYGHGTGHGVGAYLFVHEYPPMISSKATTKALENMFTSNEPGYYKDGQYGIRIEDVIQVIKSDIENAFSGMGGLTFKSITYAPLETKLIDTNLLTKEEANYVNAHNKRVMDTIGPILLKQGFMDTYQWLMSETRQICSWA